MKTIYERNEDVLKALDHYEVKLGLPVAFPPGDETELQTYFSMTRTDIEALTPTQCSAIAARLACFAFYIRRMYNREAATNQWANDALNDLMAKEMGNYNNVIAKHEVKIAMMAKENKAIEELCRLLSQSKQRMLRLEHLGDNLQYMARTFENNQRAKAFENR